MTHGSNLTLTEATEQLEELRERKEQMEAEAYENEVVLLEREYNKAAYLHPNQNTALPRGKYNRNGAIPTPTQRCTADGKKGKHCRCKTKIGMYCGTHRRLLLNLRVAKSNLAKAGKGLFATKDFKVGDFVANYTGDLYPSDDALATEKSVYLFQTLKGTQIKPGALLDGARTNSAEGRGINDSFGSPVFKNNCQFALNLRSNPPALRIITTKAVKAGEEFFVPYGKAFWATKGRFTAKKSGAKVHSNLGIKQQFGLLTEIIHAFEAEIESQGGDSEFNPDNIGFVKEPKNIHEALKGPDKDKWMKALKEELDSLKKHGVYTVVDKLPPGKKALGHKIVMKVKCDKHGNPIRYKVRATIQGFLQRYKVDYNETFAPTLALRSLRTLFAVACGMDLELKHMDVVTAFLHGDLEEEIYMHPLPGMDDCKPGQFLKLNKTLYGLKQASNRWNHKLVTSLNLVGFTNLAGIDECIFVKVSRTGRIMIIAAYVDDLFKLCHKEDIAEMEECCNELGKHFELKELGDAELALGMRIIRDRHLGTLSIDQTVYLTKLLKQYGMYEGCRPYYAPAMKDKPSPEEKDVPGTERQEYRIPPDPEQVAENDRRAAPNCKIKVTDYRSIVGALQYAATCTRPDISQAVSELASHSNDPQEDDMKAMKRVMRYLRGSLKLGLIYQRIIDHYE